MSFAILKLPTFYSKMNSDLVSRIQTGERNFDCKDSEEIELVVKTAEALGYKTEIINTTEDIQFSCKDWALYKRNIHEIYKNRNNLVKHWSYYAKAGIYDCEDENLCGKVPHRYERIGNNYDDDQAIYLMHYTRKTGVKIL